LMQDSVIIDALNISLFTSPRVLCDSGNVQFNNTIRSFSNDSLRLPLIYQWDFGTGKASDTADTKQPSFFFNKPAQYTVTATIQTALGCEANITDTITVLQKPKGKINGVDSICAGASAQFTGDVSDSTLIKWSWNFANGITSNMQNPPVQNFVTAGNYKIQLVVYSTPVCADTVYKQLSVHPNPVISPSPKDTLICKGDSLTITAHDGVNYEWSSTIPISNPASSLIKVSPVVNTVYKVKVTNQHGCSSRDSSVIRVSQPFKITVNPLADSICYSSSTQLNAQGAVNYKWSPSSTLNSSTIA